MVDFLGQELKIGDDVVYCRYNRTSTSLTKTKIVGFTNQMVQIEDGSWGNVHPDKLIKIEDKKQAREKRNNIKEDFLNTLKRMTNNYIDNAINDWLNKITFE